MNFGKLKVKKEDVKKEKAWKGKGAIENQEEFKKKEK